VVIIYPQSPYNKDMILLIKAFVLYHKKIYKKRHITILFIQRALDTKDILLCCMGVNQGDILFNLEALYGTISLFSI
jgi:hypothetical protein